MRGMPRCVDTSATLLLSDNCLSEPSRETPSGCTIPLADGCLNREDGVASIGNGCAKLDLDVGMPLGIACVDGVSLVVALSQPAGLSHQSAAVCGSVLSTADSL